MACVDFHHHHFAAIDNIPHRKDTVSTALAKIARRSRQVFASSNTLGNHNSPLDPKPHERFKLTVVIAEMVDESCLIAEVSLVDLICSQISQGEWLRITKRLLIVKDPEPAPKYLNKLMVCKWS